LGKKSLVRVSFQLFYLRTQICFIFLGLKYFANEFLFLIAVFSGQKRLFLRVLGFQINAVAFGGRLVCVPLCASRIKWFSHTRPNEVLSVFQPRGPELASEVPFESLWLTFLTTFLALHIKFTVG